MRIVLLVTVLRKKRRKEETRGNSASLSESKVNLQAYTEEQLSTVPHNRMFCDRELCHHTLFTDCFSFVVDKWNPHLLHLRAHKSFQIRELLPFISLRFVTLRDTFIQYWTLNTLKCSRRKTRYVLDSDLKFSNFVTDLLYRDCFFNSSSHFDTNIIILVCNVSSHLSKECFI